MKILIAGVEQLKSEERYMDEKGWAFRLAFEKLGMKCDDFFYKKTGRLAFIEKDKLLKKYWLPHMNRALLSHVIKTRPDLLLICKGETIEAQTLWEIRRKTETIIVNVFPDNPILMGNFNAIAPCHHYFIKDTYVVDTLWKAGLNNVKYLPQCTDPNVHKPMELSDSDTEEWGSGLSLLGSMYPYRHKVIEELLEFSPAIWGRGWAKTSNPRIAALYRGRDIRGTAKAKAISASAISLNLHHPLNDINGVNRRMFDVSACMGFQLADYKPDMTTLMKIGEEIICFRTLEELRAQIGHYLNHPGERASIARAGYDRVLKDHTYDNRAQEILAIVQGAH